MTDISIVPIEHDDLSTITRDRVLAGVDEALAELAQTGDIQRAVRVLDAFDEFQDMSGFGKAKMLWGSKEWFVSTGQSGDFYEKFGISDKNGKVYADRMMRLWSIVQSGSVPKRIVRSKGIRELTPITEALSQGYEITSDQWKEIERIGDFEEIGAYLQREVKKKETRSHAIRLTIDADGTITAWKQNKPHFIGSLNVQEQDENPVIAQSIRRIISSSRIKEQKK